jgi:hypothetical protein
MLEQVLDLVVGMVLLLFLMGGIVFYLRTANIYFDKLYLYHTPKREFEGINYIPPDTSKVDPPKYIDQLPEGKTETQQVKPIGSSDSFDSPEKVYDFQDDIIETYGETLLHKMWAVLLWLFIGGGYAALVLTVYLFLRGGSDGESILYTVSMFAPTLLLTSRYVVLAPFTPFNENLDTDYHDLIRDTMFSFIGSTLVVTAMVIVNLIISGTEQFQQTIDAPQIAIASVLTISVSVVGIYLGERYLFNHGVNDNCIDTKDLNKVDRDPDWLDDKN